MNSIFAKALFLLSLAAAMMLTSCDSTAAATTDKDRSGIYYYRTRAFTGGRYETGTYFYNGKSHTNRYYFNGRYYYGGRLDRNPNVRMKLVPPQPLRSRPSQKGATAVPSQKPR